MIILFDIYSTQFYIGGGAEYVRRVFYTLLGEIKAKNLDVSLVALMDKSKECVSYPDLSTKALEGMGVEIADISVNSLKDIIINYHIDKVFIGIAQYWSNFDIDSLYIPAICIIHDLCDEETQKNRIFDYVQLDSFKDLLFNRIRLKLKGNKQGTRLLPIIKQAQRNTRFEIITVSEYSRTSISYHYSFPIERISVLYSPERVFRESGKVQNEQIKDLIRDKKKYYLILSANRVLKNAKKAINAFERYLQTTGNQSYLVTTGLNEKSFENHIILPYLSESDLEILMKNCYAFVFPSFFEGFGYPPIEAMKYGKPVLASNTTSISEICGQAPLYFSPFYESDIYRCLVSLTEDNYKVISLKSRERYDEVNNKQRQDLKLLIEKILDK